MLDSCWAQEFSEPITDQFKLTSQRPDRAALLRDRTWHVRSVLHIRQRHNEYLTALLDYTK